MLLKKLELAHVRVFDQAEFEFQPGMNLLVGINGAGKSTVLDVLRKMFSYSLRRFTASGHGFIPFEENDITVGQGALTARLEFVVDSISFEHLMHKPSEKYGTDEIEQEYEPAHHVDRQTRIKRRREQQEAYKLERRNDLIPDEKNILASLKNSSEQPLVIFYSILRSLPVEQQPSKTRSTGGQTAAFADALNNNRPLNIRELAEWWLVQETLATELGAKATRRLTLITEAVTSFLDSCTNLRAVREPAPTLLVDKEHITLNIHQLSDGERSVIALVFDLARRLVQANPKLDNPLHYGKAVVLIDELDLHLHPGWQRTICEKLTTTFPNCQFIATTHSPQIVGEVSPDNIIIIEHGATYRPDQSLGMDSNWILQYLMGVDPRDAATMRKLKEIENWIENEQYDEATVAINVLRNKLGEFPQLVSLQARLDMIEFLSNEKD